MLVLKNFHLVLRIKLLTVMVLLPTCVMAQSSTRGGSAPTEGLLFGSTKSQTKKVSGPSLAATDESVIELRIVGNKLISKTQILSQIETRVGRPFDPVQVQRDVRKLASRSWFVDVRPLYERTPAGRIVIFQVVERPSIRYIEYLGNKRIRDKKLAKETGLQVGGSVDPYAVEEARRRLDSLYQRSGFNDVQISILEGNKPTDQGVVFVIHEGTAQRIWKVEFVGNSFVSGRRLKTQIESKPPIAMVFKGFVDRDQIDADVTKLTAYYRAFGFFQAKVGRKLEYNEKGNWLTLKFIVHEGDRYSVRNVAYQGNEIFADESFEAGTELLAGYSFEQAKMNADVRWLKELYGSKGYVFADVRAEPVFLEEPGQIDLVYHIEEGKRWRVGRVFVHIGGDNPHTRILTAMNRISLRPGEIVDIREVKASERRLQASSLFLADPAQGVMPKISYRIQELGDEEVSIGSRQESSRGASNPPHGAPGHVHRGQSPDPSPKAKVYEVRRPPYGTSTDNTIDVHLHVEENRPTKNPYQNIIVRTQSPYQQAPYQQTISQTTPEAYGGRQVGATGPSAVPAGGGVRPVQYVAPGTSPPITNGPQFFSPPPVVGPPVAGPPIVGPPVVGPPIVGPPVGPPGYPRSRSPITPLGPYPLNYPEGPVDPLHPGYNDPAVDLFVDLAEAQTGRFMIGAAVNSNAGLVGQILLDERNFDWRRYPTSMDELTSGRAWRGGGQRFRLEAAPGTQVQRYLASFQEPYLWDTPISFGLSGSFFDRRFLDWDEQRVGGRISFGYQWTENDLSANVSYRGEQVKIRNASVPGLPELAEVLGDNNLHGFRVSVANDTRNSAFLATSGHLLELSLEQVVGTFEYPRAIFDGRQYFLMRERPDHSGRHVLSMSTRIGFTGENTPIYEHFFAGGYSTLRGFDFRGASPVKSGVQVGGEFMWINTLEYLFPLTADDMIHGVVFCDFGTVEDNVTIKDFRAAPGFGLRITVPAMGPAPIALDFAWPIASADTDDRQVFSFNIGLQR